MFDYYKKLPACPHCNKATVVRKHGTARSRLQRYRCCDCRRTFQAKYIYFIHRVSSVPAE
ncbi:transposase [Budvicia aquatica]